MMTSKLRVQLTSAHIHALTARAGHIVSQSQRNGDGAKKERVPLLEPHPTALKSMGSLIQAYGRYTIFVEGRCSYNSRKK